MSALFGSPKVPKVQPIPEVEDKVGLQNDRLRRLRSQRASTIFGGGLGDDQRAQTGVATKTLLGG